MSTQYGYDSFTRSNSSGSWGTATDGQTYTQSRGNQTLSISSNEGVMTYNGNTNTGIMTMGSKTVGDGEYLVRCTQSNTSDIMGICPRFKDSNNFYSFVQGATAGQFQLRLDNASTFSTVAGVAFTSTVGTFYWVRCRIIGTSFFGKIWQDGTSEPNTWQIGALGVTDTTIAGPQSFGLAGCPNISAGTVKFDHFYAFDYINSESIPVADVGGLQIWNVDSLTIGDVGEIQLWNADNNLIVTDVGNIQFWNIDGNTVSDVGNIRQWALDNLTIVDTGSIRLWNVDSLSTATSSAYTDTTGLIESNVVTDSQSITDTIVSTDTLSATDSSAYGDTSVLTDATTISDVGGINQSGVDALSASDTTVYADGISLIESNGISDVGNIQSGTVESLTASDATIVADNTIQTDPLSITDAQSQSATYDPIEALIASDAFISTETLVSQDALNTTDISVFADGTTLTDSISTSDIGRLQQGGVDALVATDGVTYTDTTNQIDTILIVDFPFYEDNVGLVDGSVINDSGSGMMSNQTGPTNNDLSGIDFLIISDSLIIDTSFIFPSDMVIFDLGGLQGNSIDALLLSDSLAQENAYNVAEVLSPLDLLNQVSGYQTDTTLTTSSNVIADVTLSFSDSLIASDMMMSTISPLSVDSLIVLDAFNQASGYQTDNTLPLSENALASGDISYAESLITSDTFLSLIGLLLADTLVAGANLVISGNPLLLEQISLSDALLSLSTLTNTENLVSTDIGGIIGWISDTLVITESMETSNASIFVESQSITENILVLEDFTFIDGVPISDTSLFKSTSIEILIISHIGYGKSGSGIGHSQSTVFVGQGRSGSRSGHDQTVAIIGQGESGSGIGYGRRA